ncbi:MULTISPECIES: WG repeat-containing protein [Cyanophyceae]|uniref:WG repeat-containing protein n=1 Tax=Cyanophyceae TaxID=3028117 RepID=UPI001681CB5B|nr:MULTISPECIES: WG repeat-containing protein [Cyanophyceae]MBD1915054.1 WG repeat-containing protein [Phormidium sp. FACHB-77]MBD2030800.1 WG repeat-containing protein [Phormidium sp. FACHB-322]MBD2053154.1 WG repeat-containing protein [Leptolyngbya sp. FACHB-60]
MAASSALAFSDTQSHWAATCIDQLAAQRRVSGYPEGSFRPQATLTRTEFAVLMLNSFGDVEPTRSAPTFRDVPSTFWGYRAIRDAYAREFFSGYPDGTFRPTEAIPRVQAIAILANATHMSSPEAAETVLQRHFDDAQQVPPYARNAIAAGTVGRLVVNYPNLRQLQPNRAITRGEVAALICQSLNLARTVPVQYVAGDRTVFTIPPELGGFDRFSEGLVPFLVNGKVGYMNQQGATVIAPQFDEGGAFSDGLAAVRVGAEWGFIDRTGAYAIPRQFTTRPEDFSDGLAAIRPESELTGLFIDKTGAIAIRPYPYYVTFFTEGLAAITVDGQSGFIDKTGAIAIQPQFEQVRAFSDGLAAVKVRPSPTASALWGYIDRTGAFVIEPQYYDAEPFAEGLAAVLGLNGDGRTWGYINRAGETAISPQFFAHAEYQGLVATPFSGGIAMVRRGEQAGFIDRTGRYAIAPQFVDADRVSNGMARVNVGGTWTRVQTVCSQSDGCFYSSQLRGGKWGYIQMPRTANP